MKLPNDPDNRLLLCAISSGIGKHPECIYATAKRLATDLEIDLHALETNFSGSGKKRREAWNQ